MTDPRSISLGKQPKLARSPLRLIQWTRDQLIPDPMCAQSYSSYSLFRNI